MKKLIVILILSLTLSQQLFSQKNNNFVSEPFKINEQKFDQYESQLIDQITKNKENGMSCSKLFETLREYRQKNNVNVNAHEPSGRKWVNSTDIIVSMEDNAQRLKRAPNNNRTEWIDGIYIKRGSGNQKATSLAYSPNGDIYAAYEDHSYSSTRIGIKKSTDGGLNWSYITTLRSGSEDDFLFPTIAIDQYAGDKLFISFYEKNSENVLVFTRDLNNGSSSFKTVRAYGENLRPRLCVDSYYDYYVYVVWFEKDGLYNDLYFSRSTDKGDSFNSPTKLIGGIEHNLDIAFGKASGENNLFITYQQGGSPGKIFIMKSQDWGASWSSPSRISDNGNYYLYPRIAASAHDKRVCVVYSRQHSASDHDIRFAYTENGINWYEKWIDGSTSHNGYDGYESLADVYYMPFSSSGRNFHLAYYDDGYIQHVKTNCPSNFREYTPVTIYNNPSNRASNDDFVSVIANHSNEGMVAWAMKRNNNSSDYDIMFNSEGLSDVEIPSTPTLQSPSNGSTISDRTPYFNWTSSSGATSYNLCVKNSSSSVVISTSTNSSNYTAPSNLADDTYYWWVKAENSAGASDWSSRSSFTISTVTIPSTPTRQAPSDGSSIADQTPYFNWTSSSGATNYDIQVKNSNNSVVINTSTSSSNYTPTSNLSSGDTYYWWVRAKNSAGTSSWSSPSWSFSIITSPPTPTLQTPSNGSSTPDRTPSFNWTSYSGATSYDVQIDDYSSFNTPVLSISVSSSAYTPTSNLSSGQTYYWRVRAKNSAGTSSWTSPWSFSIYATSVENDKDQIPTEFALHQNYPNPFNPTTIIRYSLPERSQIHLAVYNMLGKKIETLVNESQNAGTYTIKFDGSNLSGGIYIYTIQTSEFTQSKKLILLK